MTFLIIYLLGFLISFFLLRESNKYEKTKEEKVSLMIGLIFSLFSWIMVIFITVILYQEKERYNKMVKPIDKILNIFTPIKNTYKKITTSLNSWYNK